MRLFSAAACDIARPLMATSLRPLQLGGGLRGGVEFGARLLGIGYDQGDAILSIDVENAFNSARHANIFQEILNNIPLIARFFRWKRRILCYARQLWQDCCLHPYRRGKR